MNSDAIEPADSAQHLTIETRAFIDGAFRPSVSGLRFADHNPATGRLLAEVSECRAEDVDLAVAAARRSFERRSWSGMAPRDRKKKMLGLAALLERDAREFALLECLDSGKPLVDAATGDVPDAIETLRWHAEATDKIYDAISPSPADVVSMVVREPIGVVAAVIPWNFPLALAAIKIGPALAGGNSIVIKPAEQTPLTALKLAALAAEAGIPEGVVNVVPGYGEEAGRALGMHRDVDCVSFTGSTEVGRLFLRYAAESNLKRVMLELGGKSPVIVMDDVVDLRPVLAEIATGILLCQGENCSAGSRLLVHRDMKDRLLEGLVETFKAWKVGDPLDPATKVGALIERSHMQRVLDYIDAGRREGARVVLGGRRVLEETGGYFVEPTIFEGVDNGMVIAQEEIFGPVLSTITFDDLDDAVRIANDTRYGLAASLYTDDLHVAHRAARAIQAGTVSVNCFSEGDQAVPFGGFKQSGFGGREKSFQAHELYTQPKTVWIKLR